MHQTYEKNVEKKEARNSTTKTSGRTSDCQRRDFSFRGKDVVVLWFVTVVAPAPPFKDKESPDTSSNVWAVKQPGRRCRSQERDLGDLGVIQKAARKRLVFFLTPFNFSFSRVCVCISSGEIVFSMIKLQVNFPCFNSLGEEREELWVIAGSRGDFFKGIWGH